MRPRKLIQPLLCVMLVVGLAAAAYGACLVYQDRTAKGLIRPQLSLATAQLVRLHELADKPTNITYGEYFDRTATAVKEIEKARTDIVVTRPSDRLSTAALRYTDATQELIRNYDAFMRRQMHKSSAIERAQELDAEAKQESNGGYLYKLSARQYEEAEKATTEQLKLLEQQLQLLKELRERARVARDVFGDNFVIGDADLERRMKNASALH